MKVGHTLLKSLFFETWLHPCFCRPKYFGAVRAPPVGPGCAYVYMLVAVILHHMPV